MHALDGEEVGDAVGDDAGLAAPRPGEHEQRALGGRHRLALDGVERIEDRATQDIRAGHGAIHYHGAASSGRAAAPIARDVRSAYSTVTDLARLRGWSTSRPSRTAT